jgi:hypothetical protein
MVKGRFKNATPVIAIAFEGCTDPIVVEFAEKSLMNLLSMHDEAYYTVFYIGESITFFKRMSRNDPARFLSWFPATHTFMLAKPSPVQCSKVTNKAAYLGLEAIMAIWMSNKLPGMCIEEGHCFNDACCGCRFWGQGGFNENLTYVSFEKVEGDFLRIMVHPEFRHINHTYGYNDTSFTSSMNFFYQCGPPPGRTCRTLLDVFLASKS